MEGKRSLQREDRKGKTCMTEEKKKSAKEKEREKKGGGRK